jgi:hypothetical protein
VPTPKRTDVDYLLQRDVVEQFIPGLGKSGWVPLYLSRDDDHDHFGLFSALLQSKAVPDALARESWDLRIGDGRPGFSQGWRKGRQKTVYHRYGSHDDVRPIVIHRHFHGSFASYTELCEEFRHYHDLAHDFKRGLLLDFDRSGYEVEVARIAPGAVEARLSYVREFQAGTRLHLAVYFDSVRYSDIDASTIPPNLRDQQIAASDKRFFVHVNDGSHIEGYRSFSRLLGKVILAPAALSQAGIWPFDEQRRTEKEIAFIIGTDGNGRPVEHSSEPDRLSNYFGANPGAPHYLTPVFFRREVLSKYYADPDRYSVSDGRLSCLSLWSCQIDNNLPSHVVVFLGDLGRDLPPDERLHWRQFNVPPQGGISEPNFRRSFLGQWAYPSSPDLVFRQEYAQLNRAWVTTHGWSLHLPPGKGDEHLLDTVRIPVTSSQSELDEQALVLAKVLVDSLNEAEIARRLPVGDTTLKGIAKLAAFLEANGFAEKDSVIQFLRDVQTLRSTGSGHRKGSNYAKAVERLGGDGQDKPAIIRTLLQEATAALAALGKHFCKDYRPIGAPDEHPTA